MKSQNVITAIRRDPFVEFFNKRLLLDGWKRNHELEKNHNCLVYFFFRDNEKGEKDMIKLVRKEYAFWDDSKGRRCNTRLSITYYSPNTWGNYRQRTWQGWTN